MKVSVSPNFTFPFPPNFKFQNYAKTGSRNAEPWNKQVRKLGYTRLILCRDLSDKIKFCGLESLKRD